MKLLIQQATILDEQSPFHLQKKDILIENGIITKIEDNITATADTIINQNNIYASVGFTDIFCNFNEPGFEHKETLATGAHAAFKGGYTTVFALPNTWPVMDSKSTIEYVQHKSSSLPITIKSIAAVTNGANGKQLTEMMDMQAAGAIAFGDGNNCIQDAGLLLKALQYVKAMDGTIIQMPYDGSLSANGFMHEGITSTQLGILGLPAIAEELIVARDIALCAYANSKLHITGVSTANSIALIKDAKAKGIQITCSVTPYHLLLTDAAVKNYNTNAKVLNPLRTTADVKAIQAAILDGTIDVIASHHNPQDVDSKKCEFAYAQYGMSTIEHCFNAIATVPNITPLHIYHLLSKKATTIFNLQNNNIAIGTTANITIFNLATTIATNIISKGKNTLLETAITNGNIVATIANTNTYIAS
jgi:dihydroorotase